MGTTPAHYASPAQRSPLCFARPRRQIMRKRPMRPEDILQGKNRPFTGAEFLESLRDGREVWLYGERVDDATTHPAFSNAARSLARLYDALHDPATKDVLTRETDTGSPAIRTSSSAPPNRGRIWRARRTPSRNGRSFPMAGRAAARTIRPAFSRRSGRTQNSMARGRIMPAPGTSGRRKACCS